LRYQAMPPNEVHECRRRSWRHEDDAVELAGLEKRQRVLRQFRRRHCAREDRLADKEALGLEGRLQVEGSVLARKMHESAAARIERRRDQIRKSLAGSWARRDFAKAERGSTLRGGVADGKKRQAQGVGQLSSRRKGAKHVAAGDDQCLCAVEV